MSFPLICFSLTLLVELYIAIKSQGNRSYHLWKLTKLEIRGNAGSKLVPHGHYQSKVHPGTKGKQQERQLCHPLMFWSQLELRLSDWGEFYSVSKLRHRPTFLMKTLTSSYRVFKAKKGRSEAQSVSFSRSATKTSNVTSSFRRKLYSFTCLKL